MSANPRSRFFKILLLVMTPVGLAIGLHEAWRLAGGLVFLVAAQILLLGICATAVVRMIRREGK